MTIPFDHPSMVLGNVVNPRVLELIKKAGSLQAKLDAAREKMNSLVMMKRSLAMTINELTDMNVDVTELKNTITNVDASVTQAATDYMTVCIETQQGIQVYREQISALEPDEMLESPLDFSRSLIKQLPLSAESLQMDAQYFSFGSNLQDDTMASIEKYIKESTSNLGSQSGELAKSAAAQINRQRQNHNLAGTLIITASCRHRNVAIIEPLVLDIDKAITVWNNSKNGAADTIDTSDPALLKQQAGTSTGAAANSMTVLSGVVYGSGFIGMVHMLQSDATDSGPTETDTTRLQEKLTLGGWLENASGGFGIDASVMNEVKKMLSTQKVNAHISVIVMGAVPAISSSQVKLGLRQVLAPDAEKMNEYLSALSQDTAATDSVESGAEKAKMGNRLLQMQNGTMKTVIRSLGEIDQGSNKVLDINSLMNAFENYLLMIKEKESSGVPVHFYIKSISRQQLIQAWMEKYYPQKETPASGGVDKTTV
ncbi:hypothetical protein [Longitalea arenae]|uniref:hypothetical protein n=1 Tax=Longitalea arenae TaxID=2812558 RepID=UPI001967D0B1|nr:hypothetical protein [Longitalea arenae]